MMSGIVEPIVYEPVSAVVLMDTIEGGTVSGAIGVPVTTLLVVHVLVSI